MAELHTLDLPAFAQATPDLGGGAEVTGPVLGDGTAFPKLFTSSSSLDTIRAAMREEQDNFVTHVVFDSTKRFDELFAADVDREDFQRYQAVQAGLAGFVNHTHAAAAEQAEDFELREHGRELVRRRQRRRARVRSRRVSLAGIAVAHLEDAIRANPASRNLV